MAISPRSVRSSAPSPSPSPHSSFDSVGALQTTAFESDDTTSAPSSCANASAAAAAAAVRPALANDDDVIGRLLCSLFPTEDAAPLLAPARRQLSADEVAERQRGDDGEGLAARVLAKGGYAVFEFAGDGEQGDDAVDGVEEMAAETVEAGRTKGERSSNCSVQ